MVGVPTLGLEVGQRHPDHAVVPRGPGQHLLARHERQSHDEEEAATRVGPAHPVGVPVGRGKWWASRSSMIRRIRS